MKYFIRASGYIFHYRLRFAAAVACALIEAALWVGSFATLLPIMKIFFSEEGLHGWCDRSIVENRLDLKLATRKIYSLELQHKWQGVSEVLSVVKINKPDDDGTYTAAGVEQGYWIIGVGGEIMNNSRLLQTLAQHEEGSPWDLILYRIDDDTRIELSITPRPKGTQAKAASFVSEYLPRPKDSNGKFHLLVSILLVILLLTYIQNFFKFLQTYLARSTVCRGLLDIRNDTYARTMDAPLAALISRGAADTMSRFMSDINQLSRGLTALFGKTMVEPAKLIAALVAAFMLDWKLSLLALSIGPATYLVIRWLGKMIRKATRRSLQKQADMLRALEETLSGIKIVKSYSRQDYEKKRFRGINRGLYRQMKLVCLGDALASPTIEALGVTGALLAVTLGGYWVFSPGQSHTGIAGWFLNNHMEPEMFITVLLMLGLIFDPIRKLSKVTVYFYNADAAAQRIFELTDETPEKDIEGASDLPRHSKSLEFKDISFTYPGATVQSVKQVSFAVEAGQSVAIVGANGSGKTTLLNLLLRFYEPDSGTILLDGQDMLKSTRMSLWDQVGLVSQEPVIFNASVADNIGYGHEGATRQQIEQAAKKAFAYEFINAMPGGFDAIIGEHGTTLSGGQRQRIAIARAILRNPAILILDEAMSQIDSESEAKIHEALTNFMTGRTTLMIAHRFSTVIGADLVAVMQDGNLIATGQHADLLENCKVYKALFESQLFTS